MTELIKQLCEISAPSGSEDAVREFISSQLEGYATLSVDPLGNLIAERLSPEKPHKKILVDAHMDEVGLIVTSVTSDGFLQFDCLGGIEPAVMAASRVDIHGVPGVVTSKPIHLMDKEERRQEVKAAELYIDIGASDKYEALRLVS